MGRLRPILAGRQPTSTGLGPSSTKVDPGSMGLAQLRPTLGPNSAKLGLEPAKSERTRQIWANFGRNSAKFERSRQTLAKLGRNLAEVERSRPNVARPAGQVARHAHVMHSHVAVHLCLESTGPQGLRGVCVFSSTWGSGPRRQPTPWRARPLGGARRSSARPGRPARTMVASLRKMRAPVRWRCVPCCAADRRPRATQRHACGVCMERTRSDAPSASSSAAHRPIHGPSRLGFGPLLLCRRSGDGAGGLVLVLRTARLSQRPGADLVSPPWWPGIGRTRVKLRRNRLKFGPCRARIGRFWAGFRASSAECRPDLRPTSIEHCALPVEVGPNLVAFGPSSAMLGRSHTRLGRTRAEVRPMN